MKKKITNQEVHLPLIPAPLPDEILGSWLTRVSLLSGNGAWRVLLEATGYDRRFDSDHFDMVDHTQRFEKLLGLLGMNYEEALFRLTTLPYWLTFSPNSNRTLPGTVAIPAPIGIRGKSPRTIRAFGSLRTRGHKLHARYCPQCLTDDLKNVGTMYWHRSHQLPNVYFCHKHHCELHTHCPLCGEHPNRGGKHMLSLLKLRCGCGAQWNEIASLKKPTVQELRLAKVSAQALIPEPPSWNKPDVLAYFDNLLKFDKPNSRGMLNAVISENFSSTSSLMYFRSHPSTANAPEFCAVLAALNIELRDAVKGFISNNDAPRSEQTIVRKIGLDIEYSRQFLLNGRVRFPSKPPSSFRKHYWLLRISDPEWLRENFPISLDEPIPNIPNDRIDIKKMFSDARSAYEVVKIKLSTPGLRAKIRDSEWLNEQMKAFRQAAKENLNTLRKEKESLRVQIVTNAFHQALQEERRPARIFAPMLARISGLSNSQTAEAIRSCPMLKAAIVAANQDKKRRQLLWAGQQLCLVGERLTKKRIGAKAGLPTAEVSDEVQQEIVRACNLKRSPGQGR